MSIDVAKSLIIEAADTIINKRPGVHGGAENSFRMIGEMWGVYLGHKNAVRTGNAEPVNVGPEDVAMMMVLMKQCRAVYGDPANRDNFVDQIGYAALAGMIQLPSAPIITDKEMDKELGKVDAEEKGNSQSVQ